MSVSISQFDHEFQTAEGTVALKIITISSSILVRVINKRSLQNYELAIDQQYLSTHKELRIFFQNPFSVLKYISENIDKIVISKNGWVQLKIQKYDLVQIYIMKTIPRPISIEDRLYLELQKIHLKIEQNEKLIGAKYQQRLSTLQKQLSLRIVTLQKKKANQIFIFLLVFIVGLTTIIFKHQSKFTKISEEGLVQFNNMTNYFNGLKSNLMEQIINFTNQIKNINQKQAIDKLIIQQKHSLIPTQIQSLKSRVVKLQDYIDQTEENKVQQIRSNPQNYGHHPQNIHKTHFTLDKDEKSITVRRDSSNGWYVFINKYEIKWGQKVIFQIQIKKITSNYLLYVGFATKNAFDKIMKGNYQQTILYHCAGGLYEDGVYKTANMTSHSKDKLTITADLKNNLIIWQNNPKNQQLQSPLPKRIQKTNLYFILYFHTKGDQVLFIL